MTIIRPDPGKPIFAATGIDILVLRAGASIDGNEFPEETPVALPALTPGRDYFIRLEEGRPVAKQANGLPGADIIGGFHFAPGGNAPARSGGDTTPAINPCSIWDAGFRPACPDPRGMALVAGLAKPFWCDIYLLDIDHLTDGTSRHGVTIADGKSLPQAPDGEGRTKVLDYSTAAAIYAHHGKQLLGAEEFFAAAIGVTERSSAPSDPKTTGLDTARTSRFGLMQATGNLWVWGTDGDPDNARPSIFGGSWLYGGDAGSRSAFLGSWPDYSDDNLSARGRSDHAA